MALESQATWAKRQEELRNQKDLKIEKNADALAGPGVDRNALAAEMHKERMLDPGRRQNVALEGNFAQKLGVVAENDKSPQAEAIRKVFANPQVIRSFITQPEETAKLLARTYREYKTNLENAQPFYMVNGKPVINENSFMYQTLKDAKVDHKNVMKNPLAHDVDKLLRGIHGREEDIFKAMGAHIELKRKQEGLDAGHFSGKEKKGLQSDIKSLEHRVERELKEVKNNTTSRIADKDFKFTRAILEAEPVTAASIAAKQKPAVAAVTAPDAAPGIFNATEVPDPVVQKSPLEVHQAQIIKTIGEIQQAGSVKELNKAALGLTAGLSPDDAKALQSVINNQELLLPDGKKGNFADLINIRSTELSVAAQKEFGDKLTKAVNPSDLRGLVAELHGKYPPELIERLEKEIKATNGKTSSELVELRMGGMFEKRVKEFQDGVAHAKSPNDLRELKARMDADLVPSEEMALHKSFEQKVGQSVEKLIEHKADAMLAADVQRINKTLDDINITLSSDKMRELLASLEKLGPEQAVRVGQLVDRKKLDSMSNDSLTSDCNYYNLEIKARLSGEAYPGIHRVAAALDNGIFGSVNEQDRNDIAMMIRKEGSVEFAKAFSAKYPKISADLIKDIEKNFSRSGGRGAKAVLTPEGAELINILSKTEEELTGKS
jgi:hypothetical protein